MSSAPNEFDTYDADTQTTVPFTSAAYGITANGWRDWVGSTAPGCWRTHRPTPTTGVYLDGMHLPQNSVQATNGIADLWEDANPERWWSPTACWTAPRTTRLAPHPRPR